jgi:hypothetical protein
MIQVEQASLAVQALLLRCQRAPGRVPDALADFTRALADVLAEAAHPFSELFAAAHGTPVGHILAQSFAASASGLSGLLERPANASMARSIAARAPVPHSRHGHHAAILIILFLDRFRGGGQRRAGNKAR